ncbi:MAG: hypothetical protein IJ381_01815 [Clostridia bacterium]|nr:hypothetical protein [Clostridia bacterium]
MTLRELEACEKDVLTCEDIASCLGLQGNNIRIQAREDPARLGFPVIVADRSVRIPRLAFIAWMKGAIGA